MEDFDTRGRAIAQAYWSELEKIALSHRTLLQAGNRGLQRAEDYATSSGMSRFQKWTGWGNRGKTYKALKGRGEKFQEAGFKKLRGRRAELQQHIQRGGANQERALKELEGLSDVKRSSPSPWAQSTKARVGHQTTGGGTDPTSKSSSTLRRVAIGTGVGLGAVGVGVGGKKVYDIHQRKKQGYGQQGY